MEQKFILYINYIRIRYKYSVRYMKIDLLRIKFIKIFNHYKGNKTEVKYDEPISSAYKMCIVAEEGQR